MPARSTIGPIRSVAHQMSTTSSKAKRRTEVHLERKVLVDFECEPSKLELGEEPIDQRHGEVDGGQAARVGAGEGMGKKSAVAARLAGENNPMSSLGIQKLLQMRMLKLDGHALTRLSVGREMDLSDAGRSDRVRVPV